MQRVKIPPILLFTLLLDSSTKTRKQLKAKRSPWQKDHSKIQTVNTNLDFSAIKILYMNIFVPIEFVEWGGDNL